MTTAEIRERSGCFRELNDEMWRGALSDVEVGFYVCECGQATCTQSVRLRAVEYAVLRGQSRSVVASGHEAIGAVGTTPHPCPEPEAVDERASVGAAVGGRREDRLLRVMQHRFRGGSRLVFDPPRRGAP